MDYLSLCLICKDENDYLPEWLDYHILVGVDRFYIYDNESRISLRETLKDYIERGWVVVVDIRGKAMQLHAYDYCLQTFGLQTYWLGFIDTDEFLVPKTTLDLKELLREYEQYAGLAVSSLFFGSSGQKTRPVVGQIAGYTRRTHETFKENELVKSIVQPGLVLMPNSPHDFLYKGNAWCVNEGLLRVDGQRFPNHTEKIQLNHYYCRSEEEIDLKMRRGRGDMKLAWPRKRFENVDQLSTCEDEHIIQNLDAIFQQTDIGISDALLEKMAVLARMHCPAPLEKLPPNEANNFRAEFSSMEVLKSKLGLAKSNNEYEEARRLVLPLLQMLPQNVAFHVELASILLNLGDMAAAWKALSTAWELSPNNYIVLGGMAFYFLWTGNFNMAENTCRLLLEMAPHDLVALGMLTHSLIGQGRYEEALKVGIPVVELSAAISELPDGMSMFLIKQMADYLQEKKDYVGAARLWEAGVKCQPGDVAALLEFTRVLKLAGDIKNARRFLVQAQVLAPQDAGILELLRVDSLSTRKIGTPPQPPPGKKRRR